MLDTFTLALADDSIVQIVFAGAIAAAFIVLVASIAGTRQNQRNKLHADRREREQTLREIAAYTAEGSLSTDDAERIIRALPDNDAADTRAAIDAARKHRA